MKDFDKLSPAERVAAELREKELNLLIQHKESQNLKYKAVSGAVKMLPWCVISVTLLAAALIFDGLTKIIF